MKKIIVFSCIATLTNLIACSERFTTDFLGTNAIDISAEEDSETVVEKDYDNGSGWSFDTETGVFTVMGNGKLPIKTYTLGASDMQR